MTSSHLVCQRGSVGIPSQDDNDNDGDDDDADADDNDYEDDGDDDDCVVMRTMRTWLAHFILLGSLLRRCSAFVPVVKELKLLTFTCGIPGERHWKEKDQDKYKVFDWGIRYLGTTLSHCSAVVDQAQWRDPAGMSAGRRDGKNILNFLGGNLLFNQQVNARTTTKTVKNKVDRQ